MNGKTGFILLLAALLLTGCGGGQSSSSTGIPGTDAANAILARERDMNDDLVFENEGRLMKFYSTVYKDPQGRTKDDLRAMADRVFSKIDILRIDALDPKLDPQNITTTTDDTGKTTTTSVTPILANPDETVASQLVFTYIVFKFRDTGIQHTDVIRGQYSWVNAKGVWSLIASSEGALDRLQARINGESVSIVPEDSLVR